ncbi:hypothetical protein GUITHDRAFT_156645 [Guillardia theta CCMP2712]|uniref:Uncharacterized protein n=1 Tax=Guillardia theta (strain CCMP2712) TaxID=905079 RepID=L1I5W9_GUITC|nr:hypothetical protein GUITHDRAFT_156645 [Guillardia theta CCMP2712]EKX31250.1 hypothetical protein GUITHDRAFT_156645 [Guillardia theta CCMP2712]|eukprot:XP_005818230.1 hypothetical protein GUITHDRAFT_156645 [Guillardia theta CCMP2712]
MRSHLRLRASLDVLGDLPRDPGPQHRSSSSVAGLARTRRRLVGAQGLDKASMLERRPAVTRVALPLFSLARAGHGGGGGGSGAGRRVLRRGRRRSLVVGEDEGDERVVPWLVGGRRQLWVQGERSEGRQRIS